MPNGLVFRTSNYLKKNKLTYLSMQKLLVLMLVIICSWTGSTRQVSEKLNKEEEKLLSEINTYRKSLGLNKIKLSAKLTKVAQVHALDLKNYPPKAPCNMHSWSGNGEGKQCCYTSDHKNPNCMWDKPNELTGYAEKGYEISAMNTAPNVDWLAQWKKSKGHHQVIINQGIWKQVEWKAIGLAIRPPYAVVWFGTLEDVNE